MSTSRRMLLINNDDDMKNIIIDLNYLGNGTGEGNRYYPATQILNMFKNSGVFKTEQEIVDFMDSLIDDDGFFQYKVTVKYKNTSNASFAGGSYSNIDHISYRKYKATQTYSDMLISAQYDRELIFAFTRSNLTQIGNLVFYMLGNKVTLLYNAI